MTTRKNRRQRKARVPKHAIKVIPTRHKQIDPNMIAMAYWMIAKRRVENKRTKEREGVV